MSAAKKKSLQSMTGFARVDGEAETAANQYSWTWELRSLNNKGLDIKTRIPSLIDTAETDLRKKISTKISRGSIAANLQLRSVGRHPVTGQ